VQLTYYGHACFSVIINGKTLLFDPFITKNPLAKAIDITILKPDFILISHGHFDHIADAVAIAQQSGAKLISSYEIVEWAIKQGVTNVHHMNPGGRFLFDFGSVKCVNAVHSSSLPDGSYGANPMGFVIEHEEGAFYYSGDTALTMDMKLIPLTCKKLDLAIFPIGDNFTMGVDDAIWASNFVECDHVLGVHYDTFGWIKIDHEHAKGKFDAMNKLLTLLAIGESKTF
jgi:L-ascorbate metabolism protein UlaG (beta-lactamase superfamily)